MVSKYFEKKVELLPDKNCNEPEKPFRLEYYLLESEGSDLEELKGEKVFGIEIVKITDETEVETRTVRNLSCSRKLAMDILKKLVYNTVTPVGMPFVIDDIIGI